MTASQKQDQASKQSDIQQNGTMETSSELNDFITEKNYCLQDFINFDKNNLEEYCFELVDFDGQIEDQGKEPNRIFVQIKKKSYSKNG